MYNSSPWKTYICRRIKTGRKMRKIEKQECSVDDKLTAWKHWMLEKSITFTGIFIVRCCLLLNMLHNDVSNNNNINGNSLPSYTCASHLVSNTFRVSFGIDPNDLTEIMNQRLIRQSNRRLNLFNAYQTIAFYMSYVVYRIVVSIVYYMYCICRVQIHVCHKSTFYMHVIC